MLLQLVLDESDGHGRAVDGGIDLFEEISQTADVILVTVGNDDATELILIALHVGEVRDDDIHAGHLRIRECQSAVEDEHIIGTLKNGHILADLTQSAKRNDAHRGAACGTLRLFWLLRLLDGMALVGSLCKLCLRMRLSGGRLVLAVVIGVRAAVSVIAGVGACFLATVDIVALSAVRLAAGRAVGGAGVMIVIVLIAQMNTSLFQYTVHACP